MSNEYAFTEEQAKERLDYIIRIARVDMYKPIHIAEVLYYSRIGTPGLDINNLDSYRNPSLKWRNIVCKRLLGKTPTSSARYQHDIWNETAMPPQMLRVLDNVNKTMKGAVERYIYFRFEQRQNIIAEVIATIEQANLESFKVENIFSVFTEVDLIRRSIDKIYEIVVYSLFETIVVALEASVTVSVPQSSADLLQEFSDLALTLLGLSANDRAYSQIAHIHRVGVTNAADRGLDMWANFGPVIQVKHLSLNSRLAETIVDQVESDNIVIVCRDSDQQTIEVILKQIGWGQRVRGVITEGRLIDWYERSLRGTYSTKLGGKLLKRLNIEFKKEFPQAIELAEFVKERDYLNVKSVGSWNVQQNSF